MHASALRRSGLITTMALVACWTTRPPAPQLPMAMETRPAPAKPTGIEGPYWCSISTPPFDGTTERYEYPNYPCTITSDQGRLVLAKLGGSQRFIGQITPTNDGFTFAGKFYCPWGECDQPLHGEFRASGAELIGTFTDDTSIRVRLVRAPSGAFGGNGYGGGGYGGRGYGSYFRGYGGAGYGGAAYGRPRPRPRRH